MSAPRLAVGVIVGVVGLLALVWYVRNLVGCHRTATWSVLARGSLSRRHARTGFNDLLGFAVIVLVVMADGALLVASGLPD